MAGNHELACSSHPHHDPVLDGTTGEVIHADVDGKKAKVRFTKAASEEEPAKKRGITRLAPPRVKNAAAAIATLQHALDTKEIFGIKQALTKTVLCEIEWFDEKSQQSVGCSGAAAFDFEESHTCPTCEKTTKQVQQPMCIAHMALKQLDELPERQTSLLEDALDAAEEE